MQGQMTGRTWLCICGMALALCLSQPTFCQITSGVFSGTILDASGSVLPNAEVRIENTATQAVTTTSSNALGYYLSSPLAPGRYRITVSLSGFARVVREAVPLEVNQKAVVDFELPLASVSQSVTISDTPPLLQAETSSLGNVRTQKEVQDLPLNGRNFNQLVYLTTGVVPTTDQSGGLPKTAQRGFAGHSINGLRFEETNSLFEGIDNREDNNGWGILLYPNVDAIQEFKVQTSVSSAEFGRGGGGVINVIMRSGGRDFHGNLFEFHRNAALDAKNFFDPKTGPIPPYIRNQFGATLGGPVLLPGGYNRDRSKTFFFADYEGMRVRQAQTFVSTVPTADFRNGNFSASQLRVYDPLTTRRDPQGTGMIRDQFTGNVIPSARFDPVGKRVADIYPLPNQGGIFNNYVFNPSRVQDSDAFDVKIDQRLGAHENLSFRYSHSDGNIGAPGVLPPPAVGGGASEGFMENPAHQIAANWTHILSPNTVNEFRAGFTHWALRNIPVNYGRNVAQEVGIGGVNDPKDPLSSGLSTISVSGFAALGDNPNSPLLNVFNHFQFDNTFSHFRGKHALKAGIHVERRRFNGFQAFAALGTFSLSGIYTSNPASPSGTGTGLADLLLGRPQSGQKTILRGTRGLRRTELAWFVQDDYRATSRLTINLGLRYDVFRPWPWNEVHNRMANFHYGLGEVFAVGTKEMPNLSGTEVDTNNFGPRVGFAYQLGNRVVLRSAYGVFYSSPPVAQNRALSINPPFIGSFLFTNNQDDFQNARPMSAGFDSPSVFPTQGAALFAVPTQGLRSPYTQQWNLTLEQSLPGKVVLTTSYVGTKGTRLLSLGDLNQPRPGPGAVAARRRFPAFGSIQTWESRNSSTYHGLQFTAKKHYSAGLQFLASYTYAHAIDGAVTGDSLAPQDYLNFAADRSNGDYDVRHRLAYSWTYDLPLGSGKRFLKQSGAWANAILGGWQLNGISTLSGGRPFSVSSSVNTLNGSGSQRADRTGNGRLDRSERSLQRYFDLSAFAVPPPFTFGNSARNVLYGPGTVQFDISVFKRFSLGSENRYLQFRSEFFNLFNTPQFNNPRGCTSAAQGCGSITSAGSPSTLQRTSRQIQFALKFFF